MSLRRFEVDVPSDVAWHRARSLMDRAGFMSVLEDALLPAGPRTGRPRDDDAYPLEAVLTAFWLCITMGRPPTIANAFRVMWSLPPDRADHLGVGQLVTDSNRTLLALPRSRFQAQEYDRFFRVFDRAMNAMDASPHPRNTRETIRTRRLRVARLTPAEKAELERHEELFIAVTDRIIKVASPDRKPAQYTGDVFIDETYLEIFASMSGRAYKKPLRIGPADADSRAGGSGASILPGAGLVISAPTS